MTSEKISGYIRSLFYLLFFFTPIILWTKTSEVFEFNKLLFVQLFSLFIGALWLTKVIKENKLTFKRSALDIPIVLFVIIQIASTVSSINIHTSLFGYYSRFNGGLLSTLSYVVLYFAFVNHFHHKNQIKTLIWSLLSSSFIVTIYGILEHFGIDKNIWIQDVQNRVFSTLGQPNWLSAFLVAVLPLSVYEITESKSKTKKALLSIASLLVFTTILYTKSRSGIGALFIVIACLAIYLLKNRQQKSLQTWTVSACISIIAIMALVGTPWTPNPTDIQRSLYYGGPTLPSFEKYLNKIHLTSQVKPYQLQNFTPEEKKNLELTQKGIRVGGSDSMEIRNVVWSGAMEIAKKYPILGTGPETFAYSYFWVRPISHNYLSEWDFIYNKAHNEYLNYLATTGYLGLISYLFLCIAAISVFIKYRHDSLNVFLLISFISILITNYFGFSVVCIELLFFILPAISVSLHSTKETTILKNIPIPNTISYLAIIWLVFHFSFSIYKYWSADILYNQGKNSLLYAASYNSQFSSLVVDIQTKNIASDDPIITQAINAQQNTEALVSESIKNTQEAIDKFPNEPTYFSQIAEAQALAAQYLNLVQSLQINLSPDKLKAIQDTKDKLITDSLSNANQAVTLNPFHVNYLKSKAKVQLYFVNIDKKYYQEAIDTLKQIEKIAPTDPKIPLNIGLIYFNMGQKQDAIPYLKKALSLKSDIDQAQQYLDQIQNTNSIKK